MKNIYTELEMKYTDSLFVLSRIIMIMIEKTSIINNLDLWLY